MPPETNTLHRVDLMKSRNALFSAIMDHKTQLEAVRDRICARSNPAAAVAKVGIEKGVLVLAPTTQCIKRRAPDEEFSPLA
eukprot:6304469-Pyramimonas_sp.AAC.1